MKIVDINGNSIRRHVQVSSAMSHFYKDDTFTFVVM